MLLESQKLLLRAPLTVSPSLPSATDMYVKPLGLDHGRAVPAMSSILSTAAVASPHKSTNCAYPAASALTVSPLQASTTTRRSIVRASQSAELAASMSRSSEAGNVEPPEKVGRFALTPARMAIVSGGSNILLSFLKLVVGLVARSPSLMADAAHSLGDLVADGLCLVAAYSPSLEQLCTLGIAAMLLSTGSSLVSFSIFEIRSALQAHALRVAAAPLQLSSLVPLGVALVCVGAKESLYRLTYAVGKRHDSQSLVANAHHHRSDMLSSIAAALGIVGTLAGVPWLEPLAVLVVGGLVLRVGMQTLFTVRIKMPHMPALRLVRS